MYRFVSILEFIRLEFSTCFNARARFNVYVEVQALSSREGCTTVDHESLLKSMIMI